MKRNLMAKMGEGMAGLAALLGCNNRIAPDNLPANNIDFGRHMEVYEEDAQQGINNYVNFEVEPCRDGGVAEVFVEEVEDKNGRQAPFDAGVECSPDLNNKQKCIMNIVDNKRNYVSGEIWTVNLRADCVGLDNDSARIVHVTYLAGSSPDRLDDRVDNLEDEVFEYIVDDGICESDKGENEQNSPYDCRPAEPPVTPPQTSELDRLVDWACDNLPRAMDNPATANIDEGADLKLFNVPSGTGTFRYTENSELSASQYPDVHHLTDGSMGAYKILTAGNSLGYIGRMTGCLDNNHPDNCEQIASGFNPSLCKHFYIINKDGGAIPTEKDIAVWAEGKNGTIAEVIRPY
ncbi:hypothetical protein HYV50_04505 [Candidatus Pacearchaeota archaeon]|nr:hypothetical protein [Candidatus Pacearchaeota archaeon]